MTSVLAVGFLVGCVVGLLGGGGGILTIPILVMCFGIAPQEASADSIIIVFTTSLVGMLSAARAGRVLWKIGILFACLGVPANLFGGWLSGKISGNVLMWSLAVLLLVVATFMFIAKSDDEPAVSSSVVNPQDVALDHEQKAIKDATPNTTVSHPAQSSLWHWLKVILVALGVGLLSGFFGVGGGFAVVPALVLAMRVAPRYASSTSLLVLVINMIAAAIGRLPRFIDGSLTVSWEIVAFFLVASAAGSIVGERYGRKIPGRLANILFGILLLCVAVLTVLVPR
ncbi:sulfite exporter TauE/SafE family protein [Actinotignum urinale]|uniref:Probable membrane transporter protein n=1 Tax=Actinotignum urinale TaxID=190146 RepID=A0AAW9HXK4_9ACTO|nr:sulfite exporter TauE/SafE family protein [Actinotignum urinale]MDY5155097.1 sulfite exporter TauE/SafE family protein [Actinotignum urinale]